MCQVSVNSVDEFDSVRQFLNSACAGDMDAMGRQAAAGFDCNSLDQFDRPLLEIIIGDLEFVPNIPKYEVVQEMLRLGANVRQLNSDGLGPLFAAVLNMDTEMLRILLDAGADPNREIERASKETLLDWALWDYRYEIWNCSEVICEPDDDYDVDYWSHADSRLRHLDQLAIKYGRRRPDHLLLLRERGALTIYEVVHGQVKDDATLASSDAGGEPLEDEED